AHVPGISPGDDHALRSRRHADQAVAARPEPFGVAGGEPRAERALDDMEAGEIALAPGERTERLEAAAVLELEAEPLLLREVAQPADGEIMARMQAKRGRGLRGGFVQRAGELGGEVLELGREARLDPLARPQELRPQRAEARALAALHDDERGAEERRPALDQVPGMPVRHARAPRGLRELARFLECLQQREQREIEIALRLAL